MVFEDQFVVAEQKSKIEDDDISVGSSDGENSNAPPDEEHVMIGQYDNGVRCITVHEEELEWDSELLL